MINTDAYKKNKDEQNPVVIGAVTAVAGIAIGTATAMYLSKKDNRKKLMDSLKDVRGRAEDALKSFVSKAEDSQIVSDVKKNSKHLRSLKALTL